LLVQFYLQLNVELPVKVEFIEHDLGVSRPTAMKYLDTLYTTGFVKKTKLGRTNFYINEPLFALLGR